jgi:hypothetical protein
VLQETRPGRFKILLPGLSYFTPEVRYLDVRSVDFPSGRDWLPVQAGAPQPVLWVLWARERVESVEALARALRALPAGAVDAGLEAPSIKSMVERFRKTGGGQISEKLAVQLLPLPSD